MVAAGTRYITDIDGRAPDTPNPWGSMGDLRLLPDRNARFACWPAGAATPLDVVNDLLDFSKLEAGKMRLHREIVRVPDLFTEVSATVSPLAALPPWAMAVGGGALVGAMRWSTCRRNPRCTGMIARVRGVIAASISEASRQ